MVELLVLVLHVGSVEKLWMIRWMIERSVVVCLLTRAGSAKFARRLAGRSLIVRHGRRRRGRDSIFGSCTESRLFEVFGIDAVGLEGL